MSPLNTRRMWASALAAACAATAAPAAAAADIPAPFHGHWVRSDATCGTAPRLSIEARRIGFHHGPQRQSFAKLDVCRTCNPPGDDSGTVQVLADTAGGSPFLLFLTPGTPPVVTLQWRPLEDQLPRRYPLHQGVLKRCPG